MLSCLFITYNRSDLLEIALTSLRSGLTGSDMLCEFVVSDDGSDPEHLSTIHRLKFDVLALSDVNRGLGSNCNKGLAACRMPFVLQVQDDWRFTGTISDLRGAFEILNEDGEIGIIQFVVANTDLPIVERCTSSGVKYRVFANDHLPWIRSSVRPYSDWPHLKRRNFVDSMGQYLENVPMTVVETEYQKRIATQRRWRVAQIAAAPIFEQLSGAVSHNPGSPPSKIVRDIGSIPMGKYIIRLMRKMRSVADHAAARLIYRLIGT